MVDIEEESKKRMVEEESGGVWVPGTNESESYNEVLSLNDCTHETYFHFKLSFLHFLFRVQEHRNFYVTLTPCNLSRPSFILHKRFVG